MIENSGTFGIKLSDGASVMLLFTLSAIRGKTVDTTKNNIVIILRNNINLYTLTPIYHNIIDLSVRKLGIFLIPKYIRRYTLRRVRRLTPPADTGVSSMPTTSMNSEA